jgi:hypothetical protein
MVLQRTLVSAPQLGLPPILRVDAAASPADWDGRDRSRLQAVLGSVSFR